MKPQVELFEIRRGPKGPEVYHKETGERIGGRRAAHVLAYTKRTPMDKLTVSRKALIFGVIVAAVFVLALTFAL